MSLSRNRGRHVIWSGTMPTISNQLPSTEVEPLAVKPKTAKRMLACGKTKLYEILPELESFYDGGSRLITVASIKAYLARKLADPATKKQTPQLRNAGHAHQGSKA
jgi:hypothetical protein